MESLPRRLERRWNTLRTDLLWIGRDLSGRPRPPVVARKGPSRYGTATKRAGVSPRPLRVQDVVHETPDAVTVRLTEADGSRLVFEAGQFLTFHLEVGGESLRRAYSLSSSPLDGPDATITVKRIEGGRASSHVHDAVRAGDTLLALGPSGTFVATGARELVLIAGGSGITPIASIAETQLRTRDDVSIRLVYGNRREADVIFRERLEALARSHDALTLDLALEEPPEGWTGLRGRLEPATLGPWLDGLGPSDDRAYYLCGPEAMMDAARDLLLSRGVAPDAIHEERFRSPMDAHVGDARLPTETVRVRVRAKGTDTIVPVTPGQTLLEAGLAAGVAMPFSCAMGGCAACKCRLTEGEVVMEEPNCLSDREREEGWVLACSARPLGPVRLEVL